MPGRGVRVGSGSFRIDRKKALEVLRNYQLPDASMFLDLWIRCAVASQSKAIRIDVKSSTLRVAFDGKPFSREELSDPYASLFGQRGSRNARNQELALGLLAALRSRPSSLTVVSGQGPDRLRLTVSSMEETRLEAAPSGDDWTGLQAQWLERTSTLQKAQDRLDRAGFLDLAPGLVRIGDKALTPPDPPKGSLSFKTGHVRGWLEINPDDTSPLSLLRFYKLGVFVCARECRLPLRVSGCVNDDAGRLNVSLTGLAEDERFQELIEILSRRTYDLLEEMVQHQTLRLAETSRLLGDPDLLRLWRNPPAWEPSLPGQPGSIYALDILLDSEEARRIYFDTRVADWLRRACDRLLTEVERDETDRALRRLWRAPLVLAARGGVLSLLELEKEYRQTGCVLFSRLPIPGAPPDRVWCPSEREAQWLQQRFKGAALQDPLI